MERNPHGGRVSRPPPLQPSHERDTDNTNPLIGGDELP